MGDNLRPPQLGFNPIRVNPYPDGRDRRNRDQEQGQQEQGSQQQQKRKQQPRSTNPLSPATPADAIDFAKLLRGEHK